MYRIVVGLSAGVVLLGSVLYLSLNKYDYRRSKDQFIRNAQHDLFEGSVNGYKEVSFAIDTKLDPGHANQYYIWTIKVDKQEDQDKLSAYKGCIYNVSSLGDSIFRIISSEEYHAARW